MTWSNDDDEQQETALQIISANYEESSVAGSIADQTKTIICPSCGHNMKLREQVHN